jgi:ABC-type Mn2+/Zn2+ transport system ATPase subunit
MFSKCKQGEIVSILGPNGAGKSTAMKAMLGLLNLKSGSVKLMVKIFQNYHHKIELKKVFHLFLKQKMYLQV